MKRIMKIGFSFIIIVLILNAAAAITMDNGDPLEEGPSVAPGNLTRVSAQSYLSDAPASYAATLDVKSKSFKASGDGKADDTKAIQSALNKAKSLGGGIVYLPEGIYRTTSNIYVYSGTKLLGDRANIVKVSAKKDSAVIVISPNQHDIVIEGITVNNKQASNNVGIDLHANVKNIWITNNSFSGPRSQSINIAATGVKHVQVSGNHFEKVTYGVLTNRKANDVKDVRIVNNQFIDIYGDAIELNHPGDDYVGGEQFIIANNYISVPKGMGKSAGAGFGIGIAGATNVTIIGNIIERARYEAIHIEDKSKHITIVGNIINGVDNDPDKGLNSGIYIIDGDYITISDNSIFQAHDYGIHLEYAANNQATNTVISSNTITDNGKGGIRIAGGMGESSIIVSQNIITGNKGDGIRLDGEMRDLKITDNIVKNNTGYGLFFKKSGLGWYLSGNSLYGNQKDEIGYGSDFTFPVPLRNQNTVIVTAIEKNTSTTPWNDAFSLGSGANGTLYVTAKQGTAYSTKIYEVAWDGTTFTASPVSKDAKGSVEVTLPQMSGNKLQIQAYSSTAGSVAIDVQFEGLIMMK
ncbi:right-handed parallel beta-helix repeat-containing protein [Paenibacillus nasutitermitis]|uniref:Pectate lyase superfamily protein domain-containing protein n=1 Tax=Paenibacillus nasutitermitis TaxID=1652958 RepID=A0A917DXH1_9BACL|nr:right-handed parallel beta-helix repeat-containing protein [Paenibacillus nasutitermitis]GGD76053.1 hypothetical protein GCM10010911_37600 [Paenibacillus nasutitermitis]